MRRRDFIAGLGSAAALPVVPRAQQAERVGRVGVLMNISADDPDAQKNVQVFLQGLQRLGWTEGRNILIEIRWGGGNSAEIHRHAVELVALAPDVIVSTGPAGMAPL